MNNKTTVVLCIFVGVICAIIGIGFATSQPPQPLQSTPHANETSLSQEALETQLLLEQPAITNALTAALPQVSDLYTVERGKLYDKGQWYGAILQYKGPDTQNRDTLRVVLKKESGAWKLKTTPPQPLVSAHLLPDAPLTMLNDINRAATLRGTENSPTITPNE